MSTSRRLIQKELDAWKRALPLPTSGRKAMAIRQLRDHLRAYTLNFRDWLETTMQPNGLTVPQLRMLFAVKYEAGASSARIARLCQVTPQTMQAMLERAVREGWLVRRAAADNARVLISTLTARGEHLLQSAMDATSAFEARIWRDRTTADLEAMNASFARALQRMGELAEEPVPVPANRSRKPKVRTKL